MERVMMAECIRLPKLGANVGEGVVGPWRRAEGDAVRAGEALVEIVTSKATFDVESPRDGALLRVFAPERSSVPVGYVLAVVGDAGEEAPDVSEENAALVAAFRAEAHSGGEAEAAAGDAAAKKVRATPGARRAARELGIDLTDIPLPEGSRVVREADVRRMQDCR